MINGLKQPKKNLKNIWSDEAELREMLSMCGKYPIQEIAEKFKRPLNSIRAKANKMGYSIAHPDNVRLQ